MSEPPPRSSEQLSYDPMFIGRGFAWPLDVDHTGSIRLSETTEDIERAMRIILLTAPGERVMRPRFGCRIWDLLFEPISPNLLGLIADAVKDSLAQWEPRIDVMDVRPIPDREQDGLIRIMIEYRVRTTNDRRNLVFPFYLIPHDGE